MAEELAIFVSAHFGVPAEVRVVRRGAPALEHARPHREYAVGAQPDVFARVEIAGLIRQHRADLRRRVVRQPHRAAG